MSAVVVASAGVSRTMGNKPDASFYGMYAGQSRNARLIGSMVKDNLNVYVCVCSII